MAGRVEFGSSVFLHHAILVEGETVSAMEPIRAFVEDELGVPIAGNPDAFVLQTESLGIDEARELRRRQEMGALGEGGRKIFIIAAHTITSEAQNALLKTLEEPTEGTHLFLVVPHAEALLPTLRSRMSLVKVGEGASADSHAELARAFLKAKTMAERTKLVKPILDTKDKARAAAFVDRLIVHIRAEGPMSLGSTASMLSDLLRMRQYLATRSPSVKMLLEHAMSVVPIK